MKGLCSEDVFMPEFFGVLNQVSTDAGTNLTFALARFVTKLH